MVFFSLPINGLDDFEAPVAPKRWNGFPVPMVSYAYAVEIAMAVGDDLPEPYEGLKPYDGLCWEIGKVCPLCASPLTLERGVINEPCLSPTLQIVRRSRPCRMWACYVCEHVEEVR